MALSRRGRGPGVRRSVLLLVVLVLSAAVVLIGTTGTAQADVRTSDQGPPEPLEQACAIDKFYYTVPSPLNRPNAGSYKPAFRVRYDFIDHPVNTQALTIVVTVGLASPGAPTQPARVPLNGPGLPTPTNVVFLDETGTGIGYGGTTILDSSGSPIPFGCTGTVWPPGSTDFPPCFRLDGCVQERQPFTWSSGFGITLKRFRFTSTTRLQDPPGGWEVGWGPVTEEQREELFGDTGEPAWMDAAREAVPSFNDAVENETLPPGSGRLIEDDMLVRVRRVCDPPREARLPEEIVHEGDVATLVYPEPEEQSDVVLVKVETSDDRITRFERVDPPAGEHSFDVLFETTDCIVQQIRNSENPAQTALSALARDDIRVQGGGMEYAVAKAGASAQSSVSSTPEKLRVDRGETKRITYRGQEGTLQRDTLGRRTFTDDSGDTVSFVDDTGARTGVTTKGAQRLLEKGGPIPGDSDGNAGMYASVRVRAAGSANPFLQ